MFRLHSQLHEGVLWGLHALLGFRGPVGFRIRLWLSLWDLQALWNSEAPCGWPCKIYRPTVTLSLKLEPCGVSGAPVGFWAPHR